MKNLLLAIAMLVSLNAFAVQTDSDAPDFEGTTSSKKKIKLSDFKNKVVVLEWLNHGCPFVKKHYGSKNMQNLQAEFTKKGVVWISVISSAEGKEGYSTPAQAEAERLEHASNASEIVLDPSGKIARLYGAQTTPHMFVISPKGKLVYQGAIDDKPSTKPESLEGARNYVREALTAVLANQEVAKSQTKSYGCGVKF